MKEEQVWVSHKRVLRIPMTRGEYNIYRDYVFPPDEGSSDEGYLVEYLDGGEPNDQRHAGYISWSPKAQFDDGYTLEDDSGAVVIEYYGEFSVCIDGVPHLYPTREEAIAAWALHAGVGNKTWHNSDVSEAKKNVSDLITFGDGDTFQLICKASSKSEGWMKSTKAMEIKGVGCVIQVTTQQGEHVAEALTFIPNVQVVKDPTSGRKLAKLIGYTTT